MKFITSDIPQADRIEKVVQTVEAVSDGAATEALIADAIGFSDRQARYYRHAAEVLGFITNKSNNAVVTSSGKVLINSKEDDRKKLLTQAILANTLFKEIIQFYEKNTEGATEEDLKEFLFSISDNAAHSTIPRRVKTIVSWLEFTDIIIESEDRYKYNDKLEVPEEETNAEESIYPVNYSKELDIKEDKFSAYELLRKLSQNKIIMNPDFQRNLVWKQFQKSQFIESIILNIPLPPLYFKKELDGKFIIIDGLQRTSTLQAFMSKESDDYFPLEGLNALPKLNGKYFHELDDDERSRIEDKNLLIYLVQPSVPMVVVYDIFNRINTGGTQLERQEIRNCIFIGESTKLLKRLAESVEFKQAVDWGISPKRMKDREAILRCLAFQLFSYKDEYTGSIDDLLERAMKKINKMAEDRIEELEQDFYRVMKLTFEFFGSNNFRYPTDYSRGRINIALMETVFHFFSRRTNKVLKANKDAIIANFNSLLESNEYYDAIRYATGSATKVTTRFKQAEEILSDY